MPIIFPKQCFINVHMISMCLRLEGITALLLFFFFFFFSVLMTIGIADFVCFLIIIFFYNKCACWIYILVDKIKHIYYLPWRTFFLFCFCFLEKYKQRHPNSLIAHFPFFFFFFCGGGGGLWGKVALWGTDNPLNSCSFSSHFSGEERGETLPDSFLCKQTKT